MRAPRTVRVPGLLGSLQAQWEERWSGRLPLQINALAEVGAVSSPQGTVPKYKELMRPEFVDLNDPRVQLEKSLARTPHSSALAQQEDRQPPALCRGLSQLEPGPRRPQGGEQLSAETGRFCWAAPSGGTFGDPTPASRATATVLAESRAVVSVGQTADWFGHEGEFPVVGWPPRPQTPSAWAPPVAPQVGQASPLTGVDVWWSPPGTTTTAVPALGPTAAAGTAAQETRGTTGAGQTDRNPQ